MCVSWTNPLSLLLMLMIFGRAPWLTMALTCCLSLWHRLIRIWHRDTVTSVGWSVPVSSLGSISTTSGNTRFTSGQQIKDIFKGQVCGPHGDEMISGLKGNSYRFLGAVPGSVRGFLLKIWPSSSHQSHPPPTSSWHAGGHFPVEQQWRRWLQSAARQQKIHQIQYV